MSFEVYLTASETTDSKPVNMAPLKQLVTPGDLVASGHMRGHGTYNEDETLYASVAGVVQNLNKLYFVNPVKSRYNGEVGDVVVGRVKEVGQRRWKVETNSRLDSVLHLGAVNLPGGELRRKSEEDELAMREYLREGDLVSAEVQKVHPDGSLSLHTRSLRYGKLSQGVLVKVPPSLVKRRKSHFHNLPCGAQIILGNNGYIWISPIVSEDEENTGGFVQNFEPVSPEDRRVIVRLRNCVALMAEHDVVLFDSTIVTAFEISKNYETKDLLKRDVASDVAEQVRQSMVEDVDMT